jgi:hypothetical protein
VDAGEGRPVITPPLLVVLLLALIFGWWHPW